MAQTASHNTIHTGRWLRVAQSGCREFAPGAWRNTESTGEVDFRLDCTNLAGRALHVHLFGKMNEHKHGTLVGNKISQDPASHTTEARALAMTLFMFPTNTAPMVCCRHAVSVWPSPSSAAGLKTFVFLDSLGETTYRNSTDLSSPLLP